MSTIHIQIDEKTKSGKALLDLVAALSKEGAGVKLIEDESPYNPEFVSMVKNAAKESGKEVTSKTLWQDLGL